MFLHMYLICSGSGSGYVTLHTDPDPDMYLSIRIRIRITDLSTNTFQQRVLRKSRSSPTEGDFFYQGSNTKVKPKNGPSCDFKKVKTNIPFYLLR